MKNKLKLTGALVALFTMALFSGIRKERPAEISDLMLENVEALAAGESADNCACYGYGSVTCPINNEGVEHVVIYYSLP